MKRFFAALACAILLLGFAPLASPPARMVTAQLWASDTTPYANDTIRLEVRNVAGVGPFQYAFDFVDHMGGFHTIQGLSARDYCYYVVPYTGNHPQDIMVTVLDAGDNSYKESIVTLYVSEVLQPSTPKVEAVGGSAIRVSWNEVPDADGYEVWWGESEKGPFRLAKYTAALSYTKTYLKPGTRYWFKVRTVQMVGGQRKISNFRSARAGVPLAKPSILSAAAAGKDRVRLAWAAVPGATGYRVLMCASPAGMYTEAFTTSATYGVKTGLLPGKTYWFKVQPYTRIYRDSYYGPVSAYRAAATLPQ